MESTMGVRWKGIAGITAILAAVGITVGFLPQAHAEQLESTNYTINGNIGGSFGGNTTSTSYKMTSIGGETVIGNGSGGSYIIDQVTEDSEEPAISLAVLPGGVVGYYPLDEGSGTSAGDAGRYDQDGTLNATAAWSGSGKIGGAVDINGATDGSGTGAVLIGDHANLPSGAAFSFEAWVNQDAWYANQAIASHWQYSTSGSWAIETGSNNNLRVSIANASGDTGSHYFETAANSWNTFGSWRHVAVTYEGGASASERIKVYIDGVAISGTVTGTIATSLQNSTGSLSLGSWPGRGRALTGLLDHAKLFNRTLTPAEVNAEYVAQNSGNSSGFSFGALTTTPLTLLTDAVVKTNTTAYTLALQQSGNLTSGASNINAISGTIASPAAWNDGVTKGLGFTLIGAPTLDGKWGSGANYAAFPGSTTTFYNGTGPGGAITDIIELRLKIDITSSQTAGAYSNSITYTATTTP